MLVSGPAFDKSSGCHFAASLVWPTWLAALLGPTRLVVFPRCCPMSKDAPGPRPGKAGPRLVAGAN